MTQIDRLPPTKALGVDCPSNQLPIDSTDIGALESVYGKEFAANIYWLGQHMLQNGGLNPNAVKAIFPDELDGEPDEAQLLKVVSSLAIWAQPDYRLK